MLAMPDTSVPTRQRVLLEHLDEITDLQEQALNTGDIVALNRLSEQRAQVVREAASYVPPAMAWDPETVPLAIQVRDRSEDLQRALRQCMDKVRQELIALTHGQRLTSYLGAEAARPGAGARWQV